MTLQEALKILTKSNVENYSIVATVDSVDKQKRTCTVTPVNDADDKIFGVRFQAKLDQSKGVVCVPTVGSEVVVTFMNKQSGYVAAFSEVESFEGVVETKKIELTKDGLLVQSEVGSLLSVWKDLIDILTNFKVITTQGPSTAITPDVIAKIQLLDAKIGNILKDS